MEAFWAHKTSSESFKTYETSVETLEKKPFPSISNQGEKQLLLKRLKYLNVLCLWELKGISWDMVIQAWKRNNNCQVVIYDAMFYYAIWGVLVQHRRGIAAILLQESSYDNHSFLFVVFLLIKKKNPLFSFRHVFQLKIWKPKWHFHSEINGCVFLNKQFWILIWISRCIIYIYSIIWKIFPHSYPRIFLKPRKAIFQKITLYF